MMAILWRSESVRGVEDWDRLSFSDCERLVRGLYRGAGMVPAVAEAATHSGGGSPGWARAMAGARQQEGRRPVPSG